MISDRVLKDWSTDQARDMERSIQSGHHTLASTSLFSDEALVRILDTHPREDLHVFTMDGDNTRRVWKRGDPGDLSGSRLLEMVKRHRLWFNVLRVTQHHETFRALVDQAYDDLEAQCAGFRAKGRTAHLLISHPEAQVFYHADVPLNILWHVRGRKRAYVYPPFDDRFFSRDRRERLYRGDEGEDIPYVPEFESHARIFDLDPGDVVTWPQNTPHRVVNTEGLNVSMTTEYQTPESQRRIAVFMANSVLRRYLPGRFHDTSIDSVGGHVKATLLRVLRRAGLVKFGIVEEPIVFKLDPSAPNGRVDIGEPADGGGYVSPTLSDSERAAVVKALADTQAEAA